MDWLAGWLYGLARLQWAFSLFELRPLFLARWKRVIPSPGGFCGDSIHVVLGRSSPGWSPVCVQQQR